MRRATRWSVFALALSLGALAGQADAQDDIRTLDQTFRKVAEASIPKTVLVKSYVGGGGDRAGYGTGAIISKDGYILTCSHVIDIATRVEVVLSDRTAYPAKVLGKNKKQDYALLKIEPKGDLPVFTIGDSSIAAPGDWVLALGHPGGPYGDKQPAFSAGRVTRLHCKLPVQFLERYYNDAIQTDCPIYAGNSGGPLVNLDGELIGLNGAILMINDNAYAVPIQQVMAKIDDLKAGRDIAGEAAGPEAFAEMQKYMDPKDMEDLQKRMFENFGKLFGGGGKENPLGELFGGNGDMGKMLEEFGKMFGGGNGKDNPFGELFGGKDGQGMDLGKMLEEFGKMFGGNGKDNPFGELFGGGNGDMGKMLEEFGKMFGGGEGNPFGGPQPPEPPKPAPARPRGVERGYLGIVPASDSDRQELGGVLLGQIVKGSPAENDDLRKGDIVVSIDGQETPDVWSLKQALKDKGVGETITVVVIRARLLDTSWVRSRETINVTLGERR